MGQTKQEEEIFIIETVKTVQFYSKDTMDCELTLY